MSRIKDELEIFLITYNRAAKLDATLSAVLDENSPIKDFEIKIVDNCSTDSTEDIVKKYQTNHLNLHYIKNRQNIGGNANIVKTFCIASRPYIWILCDDDYYDWSSWNMVEDAIMAGEDAIIVANTDEPQLSIAQLYAQTSFLPGVIYKTANIDSEVIDNMFYNISNMFPHMSLSAKLINEQKSFKIIQPEIVKFGGDEIPLNQTYTRGVKSDSLHPYRKNLMYMAAYANILQLIKDEKTRKFMTNCRYFYNPSLNSAEIFFFNDANYSGSLYNLCCIFLALDFFNRVKFVINFILSKTLYKILYISVSDFYDKKSGRIVKDYRIKIFRKIKTKLFQIKIKHKELRR